MVALSRTGGCQLGAGAARAEVCDGGPGLDPDALPDRDGRPSGFGLLILDEFASRWGVSTDHGTCVWFELNRDLA